MKITRIAIITRKNFCDIVSLETDLPPCIHPFTESPNVEFRVAKGLAIAYVEKAFPGILVEIINDVEVLINEKDTDNRRC